MHRETLTRRRLYTQMFLRKKLPVFCTKMPLRNKKGTQALLHTEPFTQRNLWTEQLLHKKITQKTLTQKNVSTETAQKKLHTETSTCRNFTQNNFYTRNFSAQKPLCTAVFTRTLSHTDALTQKIFHTQKFVHTTRFYTQPTFAQRGFASPS